MPKAELDPCADAAARSLACQTANPGAKKLTVCNDVIQVYKKCRDEQLAKAREERGRR